MQKISATVDQALGVLKALDEPGLLGELKPLLTVWLEAVREYALDYEENNDISNTPFSRYRSDFRYPLSFAYAIIEYGRANNVTGN